ncbi:MAG: CBS domain-containing protein [Proteobacteria bacterium]|nr:CBS domain-containing protein [Pseudomonadota bacterium]
MIVGKRMQKDPISLKLGQSLKDASRVIKLERVRHIPVVDEQNHIVGIITDRDVKKASASDATTLDIHELLYLMDKIKIEDIMTKQVVTVDPSMPLEQAAKILHDKKFGCLPVVSGGELVGILTTADILQFLMDAMDVEDSCTRVEVSLPDKPEQLVIVLDAMKGHGYHITSVITSPEKEDNSQIVTMHLKCQDDKELRNTLESAGIKIISFMHQEPMNL